MSQDEMQKKNMKIRLINKQKLFISSIIFRQERFFKTQERYEMCVTV